jgi:hypothetical protein
VSSHCSKYPACGCPSLAGRFCQVNDSVEAIAELNKKAIDQPLEVQVRQAEIKEAYDKLSPEDQIAYSRGYKTFRNHKKKGLILVDNLPAPNISKKSKSRGKGTNFTPPKKKRK